MESLTTDRDSKPEKRYTTFLKKIVHSYISIGYRPNKNVFFDPEDRECDPLVALALAAEGESHFKTKWGIDDWKMYHWITAHFRKNFGWVEGFRRAFNMADKRHGWDEVSFSGGYRVGREIRRRLKEIYYKKEDPKSIDDIDW